MTTSIFNLPKQTSSKPIPKTHISHSQISPAYLDPHQPPIKSAPFRQVRNFKFLKDVRICMPSHVRTQLYGKENAATAAADTATIKQQVVPAAPYSKVILSFKDVLTDYTLRTGNFVMLAQPYPPPTSSALGVNTGSNSTTITINRGNLTITMSQHIYQRTGLPSATKVFSGGRKHDDRSLQYRVNMNLRDPSMVKGRKGFDRLVWAASNVDGLKEARMWLIAEANETLHNQSKGKKRKRTDEEVEASDPSSTVEAKTTSATTKSEAKLPDTLSVHHPTTVTNHAAYSILNDVLIPDCISDPSILSTIATPPGKSLAGSLPTISEEDIHDLTAYLSLLFLQSPILKQQSYGKVDPYLCRYRLPSFRTQAEIDSADDDRQLDAEAEAHAEDVSFTSWSSGLMSSDFVLGLVVDLIRRSRVEPESSALEHEGGIWAAIQVNTHRTEFSGAVDGYLILLQGGTRQVEGVEGVEDDTERMDIEALDTGPGEAEEKLAAQIENKSKRGFQYVTCFEFVDSQVH